MSLDLKTVVKSKEYSAGEDYSNGVDGSPNTECSVCGSKSRC